MTPLVVEDNVGPGLAAALVAILAFGSFAVPIKCQAARKVSVDPLGKSKQKIFGNCFFVQHLIPTCLICIILFVCSHAVLQTYKVGVCLLTSVLVVLWYYPAVSWRISPYGLVSGLLMVPGGTAGYFGVRNAGLALSQGIWSSLKVVVAFGWGLVVFGEPVRSVAGTVGAMMLLLAGLAGMSYFAAASDDTRDQTRPDTTEADHDERPVEPLLPDEEDGSSPYDDETTTTNANDQFCGLGYKTLGILGAIVDGLYGGSVLVPMHFAEKDDPTLRGMGFLLSFAVGCATVLACVWLARWGWNVFVLCSSSSSRRELPRLHVTTIGPYATLAGLIWSVGNTCSILSVAWLGQGLGYSIVQSQLIVAGLWAVCVYDEISGRARIASWFACAVLTVVSILLLTRQRIDSRGLDDDTPMSDEIEFHYAH